MFNKLDYSYNNGDSIVHRLNPVVKILGLIIYVLICFLKFDYLLFSISIGVVFTLLLFSNVGFIRYLKVLSKFILLVIIMFVFMNHKNISTFNIIVNIIEFLFFILYIMIIIYTTTKLELSKGSSKIIDIFNILGFSLKKICSFITCLYLYPSMFLDSYNEVFTNIELKGKNYSYGDLFDKIELFFKNVKLVFDRTNKKMNSRKDTMRYRFYSSNVKSKYKYRNKLCIFDYIFIIVNIWMLLFYIVKVRL